MSDMITIELTVEQADADEVLRAYIHDSTEALRKAGCLK
jgi:hypothetical protein